MLEESGEAEFELVLLETGLQLWVKGGASGLGSSSEMRGETGTMLFLVQERVFGTINTR